MEIRLAVMEQVLPIFELEGDEFDAAAAVFVAQRSTELSEHDTSRTVGHDHGGTEEYISSETEMLSSTLFSRPYYLDDLSAYTTSFEIVKGDFENLKAKFSVDKAYLNAVIRGANAGQARYFKSIRGNLLEYSNILADVISDDEESPRISIADLKRVAICQERAAVVHNTLQIFGIDSRFEAGDLSVKNEDGSVDSEHHAFITFSNNEGERYVFDPTNPVITKDGDGNIISLAPNLIKVQPDSPGHVVGTLKSYGITDGKRVETRKREITYDLDL